MNKTTKSILLCLAFILVALAAVTYFVLPAPYWILVGIAVALAFEGVILAAILLSRFVDGLSFNFFGHDN